ncbi:SANT/Myb-like DNA-binding domain-containing protein [Bradyrhizobium sp. th.b2]|uniref:SANT/Myb-like DNA-binding domain-containing protein n=1 Tax=Bradyrhizobium sp. th-b2 TaxID=172088 RepID=UPI0012ECA8E7|nr:SANT/Myb-like DNA-binding domain-containing protein [Bradyrhizobium sp. th.b2]
MLKPVRSWTAEEIEKLKAMAGKLPTGKIAEHLGRGPMAIAMKAHQLKVSLRTRGDSSSTKS